MLASVGSNQLKLWDIIGGGRLLYTLSNHQKTITSVALNNNGSRILTGSLDHHIKIYDIEEFNVVHSMKCPSPIMNLAVSPDDKHLAVGMADGSLLVRKRIVHADELVSKEEEKRVLKNGTYKYFNRGHSVKPDPEDLVIEAPKKKSLKQYDKLLKKFKYAEALDFVLTAKVTHPHN
jgi:U3 small nucleolar RNA-associated protein 15